MKYCKTCKKEITLKAEFCPYCGKKLIIREPNTKVTIIATILVSIYFLLMISQFYINLSTMSSDSAIMWTILLVLFGYASVPFSIISLISTIKSKDTNAIIWASMINGVHILSSIYFFIFII